MSIKRFYAKKDNTITNAFKENLVTTSSLSNMGASDILEIFSIYGQASSSSIEKSRLLIEFPIGDISSLRDSENIPNSGAVDFKLKMFNARHAETTPKSFHLSVSPLLQSWTEGIGMDMESYSDIGESNWSRPSTGSTWHTTGGTVPISSRLSSITVPIETTQYFETGLENLEIDVTSYVEETIKDVKGISIAASASVTLDTNPANDKKITLFSTDGDQRIVQIADASSTSGKNIFVERGANAEATVVNLITQINNSDLFSANADDGGNNLKLHITQSVEGMYGNTIVSSDIADATIVNFAGGEGLKNYGFLIRLSGSFEDGTKERSFYTKRFFARGSEFFFKRPIIESQYDDSILDDRYCVYKSSSLAPASSNLNNIYLYNFFRGNLVDIPNTGSDGLVVQLFPSSSTGTAETLIVAGGTSAASPTFITASRESKGVYKAVFCYSGDKESLYDRWYSSEAGVASVLLTGSGFNVLSEKNSVHYKNSEYITTITNLKSSYSTDEIITFRVYTRNKTWDPNIYTKATSKAPVSNLKEAYYKICRSVDKSEIITYSTGSNKYSRMSYDVSGSFFNLDTSILEPNYLYEISFLHKQGLNYVEQSEKFKFRVE